MDESRFRRIDRLCDDFETAWLSGDRPCIEDYLGRVGSDERAGLFAELFRVELEYRCLVGETPRPQEYRPRFDGLRTEADDPLATRAQDIPATRPPTAEIPAVGFPATIPGYEILGELGRGGMGVVYKARQVGLDRVVALKMILHGGHASAEERARFRTESQAIARLQHPGIVQVFEVGESGGPFFALEFCPGGNLADKLAGTPLAPREAAELVGSLARAVQAAHEANVIHRDLKPANVLLTQDGTPKVSDFGLAKKVDEQGHTRTGSVMGTPSYAAPELARGSKVVGPAADVYSLGAILYECLTGRPPFKAATAMDTLMQVLNEEVAPPRRLNARLPRDLETIALKCLHKQPHRRYASARELAEDLQRFLDGRPIQARPTGAMERAWKWGRRRPAVAALVAAVALSLLAGVSTSTALAVEASRRARAEAKAAEQARIALAEVEESLADGLLRPLGHDLDATELNDFELAALKELASLPPEYRRVRLLFIDRALSRPTTAGQLSRRMAPALRAAVGLDERLREQVRQIARRRAEDEDSSETVVEASRQLLALLDHRDDSEGGFGRDVRQTNVQDRIEGRVAAGKHAEKAEALLDELAGQKAPGAARRSTIATEGLGDREAARVADNAVDLLIRQKNDDPELLLRLGTTYAALVRRLDAEKGRAGAEAFVARLLNVRRRIDPEIVGLLRFVGRQHLVDGLKHPCCLGVTQRRILDELGRREGLVFAGLWEFVTWAEERARDLDLLSPLPASRFRPEARRRFPPPDAVREAEERPGAFAARLSPRLFGD